ncbi:MAG: hypothetical protein U0703_01035 [Anaerolineae bacterium]
MPTLALFGDADGALDQTNLEVRGASFTGEVSLSALRGSVTLSIGKSHRSFLRTCRRSCRRETALPVRAADRLQSGFAAFILSPNV